jgi:hypothetical protein
VSGQVRLVTRGFVLDEPEAGAVRRLLRRIEAKVGHADLTVLLVRERSGAFRARLESSSRPGQRLVEDGWATTAASAVGRAVRGAANR